MLPGLVDARGRMGYRVKTMTPLVTTIDEGPEPLLPRSRTPEPTVIIIFNEKSGPTQVAELISNKHSFIESEIWETVDEQDRPAWVLVVTCETATAEQLFELIGSRLPDYIQARRFPPSRMAHVRSTGTKL